MPQVHLHKDVLDESSNIRGSSFENASILELPNPPKRERLKSDRAAFTLPRSLRAPVESQLMRSSEGGGRQHSAPALVNTAWRTDFVKTQSMRRLAMVSGSRSHRGQRTLKGRLWRSRRSAIQQRFVQASHTQIRHFSGVQQR
ncbi:hypothetical protein BRADI_2g51565v3 [Brachypodium distachyon]|uniref:Uncharacterized protein n=1 Tax=Brachypodium distachyon TaxID=15368 RepID=A0A2K2DFA9_BRADI|nr:hypothetical protein BRADI_2g51565v3 [Brachypodium distachyon]